MRRLVSRFDSEPNPLMQRHVGFTLVELLIALIVGGTVAAAVVGVLRRQQRFYVDAGALVARRVALRDATGIIPGELRSLAPPAGDVIAFSDSSFDILATIGTAVACDTVAGGEAIDLAPGSSPGATTLATLTAFTTAPDTGDLALIFDAGADDSSSDDAWSALRIAGVSSGNGLCDSSPLAPAIQAGGATTRLRFVLGERVRPTVRPGAFVRVLRRVRYRFYRAASGDWFLGYSEWNGAGFESVQPVSGPFAPYAVRGQSGIRFRYFDATDVELPVGSDARGIARIEVTAHGAAGSGLSRSGAIRRDSQTVTIRLRNQ